MAATSGCGAAGSGNDNSAQEQNDKDDKDSDVDKSGWTSLDGKDDGKEDDIPTPIKFSYRNHPVTFKDADGEFGTGIYVTVELNKKAEKQYPKLAEALEKINTDAGDGVRGFLYESEDEIREMRSEGNELGYEIDQYFHPERSDEKVFSFVVESYMYLGGAHGTTGYHIYNIDPATGKQIKFDAVVKDTDGLPGIIVDELLAQNEDLVEYFEECPGDKESLLESLSVKLDDDAKDLKWSLCYDGIRICFEDYEMGSYAAGTRNAIVKFKDYPELFTDAYDDYSGEKRIPKPDDNAKQDEDAEIEIMETKGTASAEPQAKTHEQGEDREAKEEISLSKEQRQKLNLFISNFAEQGFYGYDETTADMYKIAEFAYRWTRINKPNDVEIDGVYYKLSFDKIKKLAKKYLGLDITDTEMYSYPWKDVKEEERFFTNGYYFAPAADGEYHTGFALVSFVYDNGDGTLDLDFIGYYMDLDAFWDNNETIPKSFYSLTCEEAEKNKDIETGDYAGTAKGSKNGDSYTLVRFDAY